MYVNSSQLDTLSNYLYLGSISIYVKPLVSTQSMPSPHASDGLETWPRIV